MSARPSLRDQLKARNRDLQLKREADALLAPVPTPWTPDFGRTNSTMEESNGARVPDSMRAAATPLPERPLDRLIKQGFQLLDVRDRVGRTVSIGTNMLTLSVSAWADLGEPVCVHLLLEENRLAMVAALDGDKRAFPVNSSRQISTGVVVKRLLAGGWGKGRHNAKFADGVLTIFKDRTK